MSHDEQLPPCFQHYSIVIQVFINPFPHTTILQQTTLNIFCQKIENLYNWMDNILCNFFFCHYVFKKPSAAEASESVYMRERVKRSFPSFCWDIFKVNCCRFDVCGRGLTNYIRMFCFENSWGKLCMYL